MSLLLEALKKAELAKQAAKEPPAVTGEAPPFTRDKLPDITQPMEIEVHSEDLRLTVPEPAATKPRDKPPLELAPEEPLLRAPHSTTIRRPAKPRNASKRSRYSRRRNWTSIRASRFTLR